VKTKIFLEGKGFLSGKDRNTLTGMTSERQSVNKSRLELIFDYFLKSGEEG